MKKYIAIISVLMCLTISAHAQLDDKAYNHIIHHWRVALGNTGPIPDGGFGIGIDHTGIKLKKWDAVKMGAPRPSDATLMSYKDVSAATRLDYDSSMDSDYAQYNKTLKAVIKMLIKEINTLRALHSLSAYSAADIKAKLKAEMQE